MTSKRCRRDPWSDGNIVELGKGDGFAHCECMKYIEMFLLKQHNSQNSDCHHIERALDVRLDLSLLPPTISPAAPVVPGGRKSW